MNEMAGWEIKLTAENEIESMMLNVVNIGVGVNVVAYLKNTDGNEMIVRGEGKHRT
jgi:hypothetical protein